MKKLQRRKEKGPAVALNPEGVFENTGKFSAIKISQGELPATIFNISSLVSIDLVYNEISGIIPENICSQSAKLERLGLYRNRIYGEIPSGLTRCRMLQTLSLSFNQLMGSIPTEIENLSSLHYAALSRNNFSGIIPLSIGNMSEFDDIGLE
ncbi:hypothetical protein RD792_000210 [Penstemon davidsonii]|uniref:Uncharacterized protein n=1 Tax=Penstemon davidsonii TaxID=160366 RepID=A0ABR0DUH1_9LAMI|nr:hypothetical protein RD792_000210 [Penstemon davidsonii]